jgi:hypothetical protein
MQGVWLCSKKKRKEGWIMKKMIFALAVLMATAPAWAAVDITCTDEGSLVCAVRFDATGEEPNLVRAFALDITLDNDAAIIDVNDNMNADYYIYPGSIVITGGAVTSYGTAKADPNQYAGTLGADPNGMTVEMGSLYAPTGPGSPNAPATSGILLTFTVDKACCVTVAENAARGGVVMEDSSSPTVNMTGVCLTLAECLKNTDPGYDAWKNTFGSPDCWCYQRQCRGDADGTKTGPFWVAIPDLNALRVAINKNDTALLGIPNGICSDYDHTKTGPFRVAIPDLNILRQYINKAEGSVPVCPSTHINFWTN